MSKSDRYSEFKGKQVVVTAAGNGIGRATALLFVESGANVIAIDMDREGLQATVEQGRLATGAIKQVIVDCTNEDAIREAFKQIGAVDVLVNGVGSSARQMASEFCSSDPEVWKWVLDVSLLSTMLCSRQVVPGMRDRGFGKIINISSDVALNPQPMLVDYAAAKAGVIGFTRALAKELGPFGINVNAICPGLINTRALSQIPGSVLDSARQEIPMQRIGEPEDIGQVAMFLASEASRYLTGQTLAVNGGRTML